MLRWIDLSNAHLLYVWASLYSKRTASFEAGNKENKRGWHTGDGMMYVYNDEVQFNSAIGQL